MEAKSLSLIQLKAINIFFPDICRGIERVCHQESRQFFIIGTHNMNINSCSIPTL